MDVREYAKYVLDNMYRASLSNALNITKQFINLPIHVDKLSGVVLKGNPSAVAKSVKETPNGLTYFFAETNSWVPFYLTERKSTKVYSFSEFLKCINDLASEYLQTRQMNFVRACTIVSLTDKYAKYCEASFKGQEVYRNGDMLFQDENLSIAVAPVDGSRYYDVTQKKSFEFRGGSFVAVNVLNYQMHMIIDDFVIDLWECYQNGHQNT